MLFTLLLFLNNEENKHVKNICKLYSNIYLNTTEIFYLEKCLLKKILIHLNNITNTEEYSLWKKFESRWPSKHRIIYEMSINNEEMD